MAGSFDCDTIIPVLAQLANLDPITAGVEEATCCLFCLVHARSDHACDEANSAREVLVYERYVAHTDTCPWSAARQALGSRWSSGTSR